MEENGYLFCSSSAGIEGNPPPPASQKKMSLEVPYWTQKSTLLTPALPLPISIGSIGAIPNLFLSL